MPLFWPLADAAFRCLVGLLPSAGALKLTNFYLYRNLALELGIFLPILGLLLLVTHRRPFGPRQRLLADGLALLSAVCVGVAALLLR